MERTRNPVGLLTHLRRFGVVIASLLAVRLAWFSLLLYCRLVFHSMFGLPPLPPPLRSLFSSFFSDFFSIIYFFFLFDFSSCFFFILAHVVPRVQHWLEYVPPPHSLRSALHGQITCIRNISYFIAVCDPQSTALVSLGEESARTLVECWILQ